MREALAWRRRPLAHAAGRLVERPVEVAADVVGVLDADGDADEVGADARADERLVVELLVRGRPGMDDERAGVADVGEVAAQLDRLDERLARRARPPFTPNAKTAPGPFGR